MKKVISVLVSIVMIFSMAGIITYAASRGTFVNLDPDKVIILSSGGEKTFTPTVYKNVGSSFVVRSKAGEKPTQTGEGNEKTGSFGWKISSDQLKKTPYVAVSIAEGSTGRFSAGAYWGTDATKEKEVLDLKTAWDRPGYNLVNLSEIIGNSPSGTIELTFVIHFVIAKDYSPTHDSLSCGGITLTDKADIYPLTASSIKMFAPEAGVFGAKLTVNEGLGFSFSRGANAAAEALSGGGFWLLNRDVVKNNPYIVIDSGKNSTGKLKLTVYFPDKQVPAETNIIEVIDPIPVSTIRGLTSYNIWESLSKIPGTQNSPSIVVRLFMSYDPADASSATMSLDGIWLQAKAVTEPLGGTTSVSKSNANNISKDDTSILNSGVDSYSSEVLQSDEESIQSDSDISSNETSVESRQPPKNEGEKSSILFIVIIIISILLAVGGAIAFIFIKKGRQNKI